MNKIVIAGGTGFIGKYLASKFREKGYKVIILSRTKGHINWTDHDQITDALNNADLVINLAGKSVNCRYNKINKSEILHSRTDTTKIIGQAILNCNKPPKLWINSSTATIYRHAEDKPMTEAEGEIGSGFSVSVALAWEKAFFDFQLPQTRQIALRMAIVLGREGGVIQPLKRLVKLRLGGKQGNGHQMFSWIHIEDVFNIILFLMNHSELTGVFNCSTPNSIKNKELMKSMRDALNVKIGLPAPQWLLEIGAVFIRTETELILKSRWVQPHRLLQSGYKFHYAALQPALIEIFSKHA